MSVSSLRAGTWSRRRDRLRLWPGHVPHALRERRGEKDPDPTQDPSAVFLGLVAGGVAVPEIRGLARPIPSLRAIPAPSFPNQFRGRTSDLIPGDPTAVDGEVSLVRDATANRGMQPLSSTPMGSTGEALNWFRALRRASRCRRQLCLRRARFQEVDVVPPCAWNMKERAGRSAPPPVPSMIEDLRGATQDLDLLPGTSSPRSAALSSSLPELRSTMYVQSRT